MKNRKIHFTLLCAFIVLTLLGCDLPATPTEQAVTSTPVTNTPAATPTLIPATDTQTPTPTEGLAPPLPTPTLGPAIPHLAAGQAVDITYIRMVSLTQGWGLGGINKADDHVLRTQDGGQTWRDVTPPQTVFPPNTSAHTLGYFADANSAWVVYYGDVPYFPDYDLVWYTHDGGVTWQYTAVPADSPEYFYPSYLTFFDAQHGWMLVTVGAGMSHVYVMLFSTQDGGVTWQKILDPYGDNGIQSFSKTGIVFVDAQNGWLTRDGHGVDSIPHVFRTSDGGVTWQRIDLPAPVNEPALYDTYACATYSPNAFSVQSLIVALKCLDFGTFDPASEIDYIYSTVEGGNTWDIYLLPPDFAIGVVPTFGLLFFDLQHGLALSRNIYRTDDGGQTWSAPKLVNWDGQFSYVDIDHGWAVARNPDTGEIALVRTSNSRGPWEMLHPVVGP